jgi:hypothetical protein
MKTAKKKLTDVERFIDNAIKKHDETDLFQSLLERTSPVQKEYLIDAMVDFLALHKGFYFLKVDSIQQRSKLEDFVTTEIFPHYNDQEVHLFSY